ncbi:hypothetical protein [Photobacterium kishitanii]|uniref:hypothetical protein n=1 Tax=Photobacterium kishitanii TaxID=318456 RepID=UPI0005D33F0C|nr:hypothetical protein [Photobacterium kishitanii]KJG11788.1 hypothetical protein UB40_04190 [Photobacterium kishitanii]OBU32227.1 hypothetical protein AYY23_03745 [Photobacterium kishitanii]PSU15744.1 hypothetical protein CTM84_20140 [Photobacterium kishitanii]PSV05968.1 hypothetical protein C0W96_09900 [Photobacterium kishitanii]PSV74840.1 hypothetical protein C0W29_14015 [Photobacterium kishitanii]
MGIKPNQHTQKIIRNMGNVIADVMENKAEGELLPHRQALSINGNDIEKEFTATDFTVKNKGIIRLAQLNQSDGALLAMNHMLEAFESKKILLGGDTELSINDVLDTLDEEKKSFLLKHQQSYIR